MTNFTSNIKTVDQIIEKTRVEVLLKDEIDNYQVAYEINKADIHTTLSSLKKEGWIQLSYLSAIDWPDENKMELIYLLFNWETPVYIQIRSKIDREHPEVASIIQIYPGAKYYEREAHEFFGIHFPGNPDYEKQLILEHWDDIPPLRKDFDPRAYSDKKFPSREYPDQFSEKDPKNKKREKLEARDIRANKLRSGGEKQ